jgi:hypothetical protein
VALAAVAGPTGTMQAMSSARITTSLDSLEKLRVLVDRDM